jgi:hypothetical protein
VFTGNSNMWGREYGVHHGGPVGTQTCDSRAEIFRGQRKVLSVLIRQNLSSECAYGGGGGGSVRGASASRVICAYTLLRAKKCPTTSKKPVRVI